MSASSATATHWCPGRTRGRRQRLWLKEFLQEAVGNGCTLDTALCSHQPREGHKHPTGFISLNGGYVGKAAVESVCVCFPGPSVEVGGENSHKQQVRIQPLSSYLCITLSLDTQALSNKSERKRLPDQSSISFSCSSFSYRKPWLV